MPHNDMNMLDEIKWNIVGIFGSLLIDTIFSTARIETVGLENVRSIISSRRFIFACWHSRILALSYMYKNWGGVALVSASKDGEIIARILQRQGHETIRGSTSKGGNRALAAFIKRLKTSKIPGVITPDGPQGPRFIVQPGIIILAKKTGHPIVPISYSAKKMKIFNSWDRFVLPYPFTQCRVIYGDPLFVGADADKSEENRARALVEKELARITLEADRHYGHVID